MDSGERACGPLGDSSAFTLAVASGKGGTGKTFVATNLAASYADAGMRVVLADCDVDAPNDHLFLPRTGEAPSPVEVTVAAVLESACTGCGKCRRACAFGALRVLGGKAVVFEDMCRGCWLCAEECPWGALHQVRRRVGEVASGASRPSERLRLVTGTLDIGQVKAPDVIRAVRAEAARHDAGLVVLDAPPGVACSAVSAIRGADALLLVTEPTPFGVHDLELGIRLGRALGSRMGVVVNRDTGQAHPPLDELLREWSVPVIARIPFDRRVAEVYADGGLAIDELPGSASWLLRVERWVSELARGRHEEPATSAEEVS